MPGDTDFVIYNAFELAFPLPDAFVAISTLIGVTGLWGDEGLGFPGHAAGRGWGDLPGFGRPAF